MRIDTHGQQIEVTPALRDYVESKLARLARHFDQPLDVRTQLSLDKPDHCAEATVNIAGRTLHADADRASNMYAAIDLLADKLDRLLMKHKEKLVDHHRGERPPAATSADARTAMPLPRRCSPPTASSCSSKPGDRDARARRRCAPARRRIACDDAGDRRQPARSANASAAPAIGHGVAIPHGRTNAFDDARGAFLRLRASGRLRRQPTANRSTWCSRWPCPNTSRSSTCSCCRELAEHFADAGFRDALRDAPDVDGAAHGAARTRRRACAKRRAPHDAADQRAGTVRPATASGWACAGSPANAARTRVLEAVDTVARRPSLAGYLNIIYPNKVQILGTEELAWLDGLDSRQRWETIEKIMQTPPAGAGDQQGPARVPKTCARPPRNPTRRCGSRRSAATSCSTTCNTTWRARWRRASRCTACSWRSTRSAC